MEDHTRREEPGRMPGISRRSFVGLALGVLGGLLAACRGATPSPTVTPGAAGQAAAAPTQTRQPPTPTAIPPTATGTATLPPTATAPATAAPTTEAVPAAASPTAAPTQPATYTPVPATPTAPPEPTATPLPPLPGRAELMAHWPTTATSRVVIVRHGGVWAGDQPDPAVVLQMLDAGLGTLTGTGDVPAVWRALFAPGERVLLKVNCIAYGGPTQPAVAYAVAQRLQEAGLPAENILIFDRTDNELAAAGYSLNDGGPGVQCHGARGTGTEAPLSQARVRFYQEFDQTDAVINLPTPKQHSGAGVSVSMKNHYGSVDRPGALHGDLCDPAIAELNAQANVRDKTRLIVGAALQVSPRDWNSPERENALLLSFDPVALDTVGRDILVRHREASGLDSRFLVEGARQLRTAQTLGLGATDAELIDLREVVLG